MPRIFDNIKDHLLPNLNSTISSSHRGDFCVGYFNLRGWKHLQDQVDAWTGGEDNSCRLLVGMQKLPIDELRDFFAPEQESEISNEKAARLKRRLAQEFRDQLTIGSPTNDDEVALRRLASQLKAGKVTVKLFLRHPLHAKLYMLFRQDHDLPRIGYLGSSNLTMAGLSAQGELNIDVTDFDATKKLAEWFEDRWNDHFCIDITKELIQIIDSSWAREEELKPYYIYLKMAYHLSQDARLGLEEYKSIPKEFRDKLLDFQTAAVQIAAHHINKRNGVLIGDVVGLGKTIIACAVARIFEDDLGYDTLIICPKNLVKMWEEYRDNFRMRAKVISVSRAIKDLPTLRRYHIVIIDESHNLRNREGKRYQAIREYVELNESKVILLTATPYNKTYLDLASQLRIFIPEDKTLPVRPEKAIREIGEVEFLQQHQVSLKSLAAFDFSHHAEDWQDLMRLFMVRRTRTFIKANYAKTDGDGRKYLTFPDGTKSYFPERLPKTIQFPVDENDPTDQYARMYAPDIVDKIGHLHLPRYGLGQDFYLLTGQTNLTPQERQILENVSKAGTRLIGFSRTNLFKRLESSGYAFLLSIKRHILRNYIFLYAIEHGLPLPIGTQDSSLLDARFTDEEKDEDLADPFDIESELLDSEEETTEPEIIDTFSDEAFHRDAERVYKTYRASFRKRFKWISSKLFAEKLKEDLTEDSLTLISILRQCGEWNPSTDSKLDKLHQLLCQTYPDKKIVIFTQYADTVRYLETELKARGMVQVSGVTGSSSDPTTLAWRFSPVSNGKLQAYPSKDQIRVLIATDILSEGQNLQDSCVVINYDLPWAIIRLIQRAGRVDRIGQQSDKIYCYSFLPAVGVEQIIRLRDRLRRRLEENAEVVGADEIFFDDDHNNSSVADLYNEKSGILDGDEDDSEVDLASYAYQIWKNATDANPSLIKIIQDLPPVVYSARRYRPQSGSPEGVLVYVRTSEDDDALAWIGKDRKSVTESQYAILRAAECSIDTPAISRDEDHHEIVRAGVETIGQTKRVIGGQLGSPSGARFKTYSRLSNYQERIRGQLWDTPELRKAIDDIIKYPFRPSAIDVLNRQLKSGITEDTLAQLVVEMNEDGRLCRRPDDDETPQQPIILCSLGLQNTPEVLGNGN